MSYNNIYPETTTTNTTTTTLEPCSCGSIYIPKSDPNSDIRIREDYVLHLSAGNDKIKRVNGFMQGVSFQFLHTEDVFLEAGQVFKTPVNFDIAGGPAYEISAWNGDLDGEVSFFTFNIENRIKVVIRNIFDNEVLAVGYFGKSGETTITNRILLSSCNNNRSVDREINGRFLLEIYSICDTEEQKCCDSLPSFEISTLIDEICIEGSCTTTFPPPTPPPTSTTTTSTTSTTTSTTTTTTSTSTTTDGPPPTTDLPPPTTDGPTTTTTTTTNGPTTTTTHGPTTTTTNGPTTTTTGGPTTDEPPVTTDGPTVPPVTTDGPGTTEPPGPTVPPVTTVPPSPVPPEYPIGDECPVGLYITPIGCCPDGWFPCMVSDSENVGFCVPDLSYCIPGPDPGNGNPLP